LVDGVVLAVDGEKRLALAARLGGDELSGGDQAFFVGEADGLSGAHGFVGGFESSDTDDGRDYEIGVGMGGNADSAGGAVDYFDAGDSGFLQANSKVVGVRLGGD
jgi:hypothetical protein